MKTDRFDEEFRRKLSGLSEESSPEEVERIYGYVSQHLPPTPGISWGGLAGYVAGGLILLGSLLYNVAQYQKTTALQIAVDSLRTAPPALAQKSAPIVQAVVRTDTVYVTRYRDRPQAGPMPLDKPAPLTADTRTARPLSGNPGNRLDNPSPNNPNQIVPQAKDPARTSSESAETTTGKLAKSTLKGPNLPGRPLARSGIELPVDSSCTMVTEPTVKTIDLKALVAAKPEINEGPNAASPLRNTTLTSTDAPNRRGVFPAKTRRQTKSDDRASIVAQRQRMASKAAMNQSDPSAADSGQLAYEPENQRIEQVLSVTNLLVAKSLTTKNLSILIKRRPVYWPADAHGTSPVRKAFRLPMAMVSLSKAQFFGGAGFSLGNEQLGGSVLGEIRLNPRWSVQTGVRLLSQTGFQYHSPEDFEEHEGQDFRASYAPNVAPGDEIQNIDQTYTILQIPLTVAYHYPLGRSWALRLGIGTNFDLLAQSRVTFDYERNGRDFEQGLNESNVPVSLFNNAMISLGFERPWKRFLLRASPYISPQIKRVGYRPEDVYWGGQVQVLWQLK